MSNENFYVYPAELFDPKKSRHPIDEVHSRLQQAPRSTEPQPIHDIMNNALREWIDNESKETLRDTQTIQVFEYDILKNYDERLRTRPYYYLEWQPDINFEGWYLHMINIANAHGYTVYSDVDENFYLPDGSSVPSSARARLEKAYHIQQNRIASGYDSVLKIIQEEKDHPPNPNIISQHLVNIHSRIEILTAMFTHYFAQHGIEIEIYPNMKKGQQFFFTIMWQDDFVITVGNQLIDYQVFTVNTSYYIGVNHLKRVEKIADLGDDLLKPTVAMGLSESDFFWVKALEEIKTNYHSLMSDKDMFRRLADHDLRNLLSANTITKLNHRVNNIVNNLVEQIYSYDSPYAFFDAVYQDISHPMHHAFWESAYYIPRESIEGTLQTARYLEHPSLKDMIKKQADRVAKVPEESVDYYDKKALDFYIERYLSKDDVYTKLNYKK